MKYASIVISLLKATSILAHTSSLNASLILPSFLVSVLSMKKEGEPLPQLLTQIICFSIATNQQTRFPKSLFHVFKSMVPSLQSASTVFPRIMFEWEE